MSSIGQYQNQVPELEQLADGRYENIFKLFIKNNKYIYNIIKGIWFLSFSLFFVFHSK